MMQTKLIPVAQLSNQYRRRGFSLNQLALSPGVRQLPEAEKRFLLKAVKHIDRAIQLQRQHSEHRDAVGLVSSSQFNYVWELKGDRPLELNAQTEVLTLLKIESLGSL